MISKSMNDQKNKFSLISSFKKVTMLLEKENLSKIMSWRQRRDGGGAESGSRGRRGGSGRVSG